MLYVFEDYALDTDRRELLKEDRPIAVQPQVFDVLACPSPTAAAS